MGDTAELMRAIEMGELDTLRQLLDRQPGLLYQELSWGNGSGFALNYAAAKDKPDVVDFLVQERHADVNRYTGVAGDWTPLHHAKHNGAVKAAARLLELGASTAIKNSGKETTADFANSTAVRNARDPQYAQKLRQKKIEGTWSLLSPLEVAHDYELPEQRQKLTDTFNFETRIWRATVRDMDGKGFAQNIIFFDDMPDTTVVANALKKLQEMGGTAGDDAISGRGIEKKRLRTPGFG